MARYWVYLNDEVSGPFALEQLIRQRGFSRQTLVCIDDSSGKPTNWISPAEIPELAHIFKAADDQLLAPVAPTPIKKAPSKPAVPRAPRPYTPAVTLKAPSHDMSSVWIWILLVGALLASAGYFWNQQERRGAQVREEVIARSLVENARLPETSLFSTLRQYIQEKQLSPKWEFERVEDALYHVTASWYLTDRQAAAPILSVYAFEANVQAQTVRGLNTAAVKLLTEGFPAPQAAKPKVAPVPKKSPAESFTQALDARREALEKGDFSTVWSSFSQRKRSEMARGGISRDGFLRVQSLTHRVEAAVKQTVMKTKPQSDTEQLVLIKQSQPDHPDMFIKQLWVFEDEVWKLDDEQKKAAETVSSPPQQNSASPAPSSAVKPAALPGMSQ